MTRDNRQKPRQPYQHHQRGMSGHAGRDAFRQDTASMGGLSSDDGYDWLQRVGRTRATRTMGSA